MHHEYATYSSSLLNTCLVKRIQAIQNHTEHYRVTARLIKHGLSLKLRRWLKMQTVPLDSMSYSVLAWTLVLYCGRVPVANAPGCTAA